MGGLNFNDDFYPRSPCGERLDRWLAGLKGTLFLSTLSLRRATQRITSRRNGRINFYPRSPCGERRQVKQTCRAETSISIHALLAESDRLGLLGWLRTLISIHALLAESDKSLLTSVVSSTDFYPRSPCGERLILPLLCNVKPNFYPRSPCGERPSYPSLEDRKTQISIHALLAESDGLSYER